MNVCLMSVVTMNRKREITSNPDEYCTDYLIMYYTIDFTGDVTYRLNIPIKRNLPMVDVGLIICNLLCRNNAMTFKECYVALGRETIKLDFDWLCSISRMSDFYRFIKHYDDDYKFEQHLKDSCDNNEEKD